MADDRSAGARLVRIEELCGCLASAFERLGLTADDAARLAALLVDSELRSHPDHGVAALAILAELYRDNGKLNPQHEVRVLRDSDGAILLDEDRDRASGSQGSTSFSSPASVASAGSWS